MSDATLTVLNGTGKYASAVDLSPVQRSRFAEMISDSLVLAKRGLIRVPRQLDWLIGVTVMPLMFLLMFRYIFGGTVQATMPAGENAVNYLVVGIVLQGIVFGGMNTSIGLATDAKEGLMDRFRSLPMSRFSVLLGRVLTDMAIAVFTTRGRWVNVAQPRPWSPGSVVSTFTTTVLIPSGAVRKTRTSRIRMASSPP